MDKIDNNELKFRMITSDGKSFPVNSEPIEGWQNDIWKRLEEQKQIYDAEIKKALAHCGVPLGEAVERAVLAIDEDGNNVLLIDRRPVLIIEYLFSEGRAVQRFKRLYVEGAE
ncbi:hypothetical protein [Bacillus halotolerans]|uniref:hypothetical protein n=1 Tax=Bacillus halotolerans TaxID=260554 RepID=UPI000C7BFB88|nr:hypothetical protein [Bacillus halotolerans]PLR91511.1 hypothetical protein CTZ29_09665 [Bacillus halotolerans]